MALIDHSRRERRRLPGWMLRNLRELLIILMTAAVFLLLLVGSDIKDTVVLW